MDLEKALETMFPLSETKPYRLKSIFRGHEVDAEFNQFISSIIIKPSLVMYLFIDLQKPTENQV